MNNLSLAIEIIGIIPIIYISYIYLSGYLPVRRFLALDSASKVEVILTVSSVNKSNTKAKVERATTGIGQVQGVSHLSKFMGKYYKKKSINVHLGGVIQPGKNMVLFGGPSKNEYSKLFIEKLTEQTTSPKFKINDSESELTIEDENHTTRTYNTDYLKIKNGLPSKDIGIVICCKNTFFSDSESGRLIYCAGLTSYGTNGSALWLFKNILTEKNGFNSLADKVGNKSPNFIAILNIEMIKSGIAAIELVDAYKISYKKYEISKTS